MTQNEIRKIEKKICKDGSLSEERKKELLNLLTTMKPEKTKPCKSQTECIENMIRFSKYPTYETMWQKNKYNNF
jgi:transposase-like protein